MARKHDDYVLETANILSVLGNIYVDLPFNYQHQYGPAINLSTAPSFCLAALVPTQAVFTKIAVVPNFSWHIPDIILEADNFRYVVDVYDDNDTFASVARKIEVVIASAPKDKITGLALVKKSERKSYKGKSTELSILRKFFEVISGNKLIDIDNPAVYLRELISLPNISNEYGKIDWSRIVQIDISDNWQEQIIKHAKESINLHKPFVIKSA